MTDSVDVEAAAVGNELTDLVARALGYMRTTVHFEEAQKEYGNGQSLGVSFQFQYDPNASDDDWLVKFRRASDIVKAGVWEQMGVDAFRDDNGILQRVAVADVIKVMPGSTVEHVADVETTPTATAGPNPPYFDSKFQGVAKDDAKPMYKANKEWALARYASNPQEFRDQRADKESGSVPSFAPDYKHKKHMRSGFYANDLA